MGAYVNPTSCSKEVWLADHGIPTNHGRIPEWGEIEGFLPVCLVANGDFTAAGIMFDATELARWSDPHDPRPKRWYNVSKKLLLDPNVSDLRFFLK